MIRRLLVFLGIGRPVHNQPPCDPGHHHFEFWEPFEDKNMCHKCGLTVAEIHWREQVVMPAWGGGYYSPCMEWHEQPYYTMDKNMQVRRRRPKL